MCPDMMDKAVATEGDFNGEGEWKRVQLESLLAALVDSKVVAMKAETGYERYYQRPHKQPKSHHHHHSKHCRHKSRSKALRKVRQWDDGSGMLVSETKRL